MSKPHAEQARLKTGYCRAGPRAWSALRTVQYSSVMREDREFANVRWNEGVPEMCDFSLQSIRSRPAKVGDKLVTRDFGTGTRGFAASDDLSLAVCVLPGTELGFAADVAGCAQVRKQRCFNCLRGQRARPRRLPRSRCARISRWAHRTADAASPTWADNSGRTCVGRLRKRPIFFHEALRELEDVRLQ